MVGRDGYGAPDRQFCPHPFQHGTRSFQQLNLLRDVFVVAGIVHSFDVQKMKVILLCAKQFNELPALCSVVGVFVSGRSFNADGRHPCADA